MLAPYTLSPNLSPTLSSRSFTSENSSMWDSSSFKSSASIFERSSFMSRSVSERSKFGSSKSIPIDFKISVSRLNTSSKLSASSFRRALPTERYTVAPSYMAFIVTPVFTSVRSAQSVRSRFIVASIFTVSVKASLSTSRAKPSLYASAVAVFITGFTKSSTPPRSSNSLRSGKDSSPVGNTFTVTGTPAMSRFASIPRRVIVSLSNTEMEMSPEIFSAIGRSGLPSISMSESFMPKSMDT